MALRNSVIASVWSTIERSPFSPADFDVVTDSREALLLITFRHKPSYTFKLQKSGTSVFTVIASPGEHEMMEYRQIADPSEAPDAIANWARHVRDELRATLPVYSELDELREAIEKHVKEHVEDPDSTFSQEEADELRSKLDELMQKFQDMQEQHELTQQEVNRLNQEISVIRANLGGYPKGVWYKTAANKLLLAVNKVATSKESRQVIAKAAQKMLGLGLDP